MTADADTKPGLPRIVCICGSTKFLSEEREAYKTETLAGRIVLSHSGVRVVDKATGSTLDQLHFRKIEMADEILVLNVGGYIGDSTRNEITHATRLGKAIRYLESAHLPAPSEPIPTGNSTGGIPVQGLHGLVTGPGVVEQEETQDMRQQFAESFHAATPEAAQPKEPGPHLCGVMGVGCSCEVPPEAAPSESAKEMSESVEGFIRSLASSLAKLPDIEQKRVIAAGAKLLESAGDDQFRCAPNMVAPESSESACVQATEAAPSETRGTGTWDATTMAIAMAGWDKPTALADRIQAYGDAREQAARKERDKHWTDCLGYAPGTSMDEIKARILEHILIRERDVREAARKEERERIAKALRAEVALDYQAIKDWADKIERNEL